MFVWIRKFKAKQTETADSIGVEYICYDARGSKGPRLTEKI